MTKKISDSLQTFDFEKENEYLKLTINSIREKIEQTEFIQQNDIQKNHSIFKNDIIQLQNTIKYIREELEKAQISNNKEIQLEIVSLESQNKQLKNTIIKLREKMEFEKNNFENKLQDICN